MHALNVCCVFRRSISSFFSCWILSCIASAASFAAFIFANAALCSCAVYNGSCRTARGGTIMDTPSAFLASRSSLHPP